MPPRVYLHLGHEAFDQPLLRVRVFKLPVRHARIRETGLQVRTQAVLGHCPAKSVAGFTLQLDQGQDLLVAPSDLWYTKRDTITHLRRPGESEGCNLREAWPSPATLHPPTLTAHPKYSQPGP